MELKITQEDRITTTFVTDWLYTAAFMGSVSCVGFEGAVSVAHLATGARAVEGNPVEFGCYIGHTAALISKITGKEIWLYDSFEGLPERDAQDGNSEDFQVGKFKCDPIIITERFRRLGLIAPKITKGWFEDIVPAQLPDKICFAHLDGDFYSGILKSLELVYPRLSQYAICMIHDYNHPELPGVKQAVDEFMRDKEEKVGCLRGISTDVACHCWFMKE